MHRMRAGVIAAGLVVASGLQAQPPPSVTGPLGVKMRLVASAEVPVLASAWPMARPLRAGENGQGFWAVPSSPAQAWVDLEALTGPLPASERRSLADGVEGWVVLPQGCAHVIVREVRGAETAVSRVEIRACR